MHEVIERGADAGRARQVAVCDDVKGGGGSRRPTGRWSA